MKIRSLASILLSTLVMQATFAAHTDTFSGKEESDNIGVRTKVVYTTGDIKITNSGNSAIVETAEAEGEALILFFNNRTMGADWCSITVYKKAGQEPYAEKELCYGVFKSSILEKDGDHHWTLRINPK